MECLDCGYSLRGLGSGVRQCPECGRAFDPGDAATFGPRRDWTRADRALLWTLLVIAGAPMISWVLAVGAQVVAWCELGHWPRAWIDDPKQIGPATHRAHELAGVACSALPIAFFATAGLVIVLGLRQTATSRSPWPILGIVAAMWLAAFLLLALDPVDTVKWFFD